MRNLGKEIYKRPPEKPWPRSILLTEGIGFPSSSFLLPSLGMQEFGIWNLEFGVTKVWKVLFLAFWRWEKEEDWWGILFGNLIFIFGVDNLKESR